MITKPMLAGTLEDIDTIEYPILCTPKLDGIRCLVIKGKVLTRNFKPIPNNHVRGLLEYYMHKDWSWDGELILPGKSFNEISSAIMSEDGKPEFVYKIFDVVGGEKSLNEWYHTRMLMLSSLAVPEFCERLVPHEVNNKEGLLALEEKFISQGYEGLMIRSFKGPYKCGRSTNKEGYLLKMKRFLDSEAEIIGFEEKWHNTNEAKKDELGRTKRSSHQENLVGAGMLGKFVVRDLKTGVEFSIGSGYDDELRKEVWKNPYSYIRKVVKYKYQPSGMKDLPRFPVFLGFRHKDDM